MDDAVADRYDAVLFDLDGVLYRGDEPIPGAADVLRDVRRRGSAPVFLTNNSSRTPADVAAKLGTLGIAAEPGEVVTSAVAMVSMLRAQSPTPAPLSAFVIGERGVREALEGAGISVLSGEPSRADLVVVGWDRTVDYAKLRTASLLVQRGARLIATNADASYPAPDGLWPGAGALLAAVVATTGATPAVAGKPAAPMFRSAAAVAGARRPLVVGDRLDTDVAGAHALGWDSMLVLTGAAAPADLLDAAALPAYLAADVRGVLGRAPAARARPATDADAAAVDCLLEEAGLATGVERRLDATIVVTDGGADVVATAAVVGAPPVLVLRSVAVAPRHRGSGLGTLVVAHAAARARAAGADALALFTETAPGFFSGLGFRHVERGELPKEVANGEQAREECAAAAAAMLRPLGAERVP